MLQLCAVHLELGLHGLNAIHAPHRVVVPLANLRQVERSLQVECRDDVRSEDLGQSLGDRLDHRYLATADLIDDRIGFEPLVSSLHGGVRSGESRLLLLPKSKKLRWTER